MILILLLNKNFESHFEYIIPFEKLDLAARDTGQGMKNRLLNLDFPLSY